MKGKRPKIARAGLCGFGEGCLHFHWAALQRQGNVVSGVRRRALVGGGASGSFRLPTSADRLPSCPPFASKGRGVWPAYRVPAAVAAATAAATSASYSSSSSSRTAAGLALEPVPPRRQAALRGRQARPLGPHTAPTPGPPGARALRRSPRWPSRWSRAASTACSTRTCRTWSAVSATTKRTR